MPQVEAAHAALSRVRKGKGGRGLQGRGLVAQSAELDAQHDRWVRGILSALSGLALISSEGEEMIRLRDWLFPEGLEHTQKTHLGKAGHASFRRAQLNDSLRRRLRAIRLNERTLLEVVEAWLEGATRLGEVVHSKVQCGNLGGVVASSRSPGASTNSARVAWLRITNALLANAALVPVDATTEQLLFGNLRHAEQIADQRSQRRHRQSPRRRNGETPSVPGETD